MIDDKAKYTDWNKPEDIKAELQFDLMVLLDEWGYPPIDRSEVYKEIFEQVENFKQPRVAWCLNRSISANSCSLNVLDSCTEQTSKNVLEQKVNNEHIGNESV